MAASPSSRLLQRPQRLHHVPHHRCRGAKTMWRHAKAGRCSRRMRDATTDGSQHSEPCSSIGAAAANSRSRRQHLMQGRQAIVPRAGCPPADEAGVRRQRLLARRKNHARPATQSQPPAESPFDRGCLARVFSRHGRGQRVACSPRFAANTHGHLPANAAPKAHDETRWLAAAVCRRLVRARARHRRVRAPRHYRHTPW